MSADELRQAAALMRELADKAAKQPVVKVNVEGVWLGSRFYMVTTPDREYALADWLEVVASRYDALLDTFAPGSRAGAITASENVTGYTQALAVATAYLGSP